METRAHHVLIGLFVVIAVTAAVLFTLWLWRPTADRDYNYYIVGFTRAVSGLSEGSRVEYSGIRVGEVMDLSLSPDDPRRVRALIRVEKETPINVDTKADLALANISGAMKIQLSGGSPSSERIEGDINDPPLIVAEPSTIAAALETGEGLITGLNELSTRLDKMLSEQNIRRLSQTLDHLEKTTRVLAERRSDIDQALTAFAQLTTQGNATLGEIERLARDTNVALNQPGQGLLVSAAESLQSLQRASKRVDDLLARNEGAMNDGLEGIGELGPALVELRNTLANLSAITRRLEENPSGFLFRGEALQEFEP